LDTVQSSYVVTTED